MKEHPILFSTEMVQAILKGRKTQTRRVVKFPKWMQVDTTIEDCGQVWCERELAQDRCPYGQVGDRLWVRETFVLESDLGWDIKLPTDRPIKTISDDFDNGVYHLIPHYRATEPEPNIVSEEQEDFDDRTRWKPSIFMPRWASRITLEITGIRVERLQEIDELGALNEGTPEKYWDLQQGDMQTSAGIVKGPFLTGTAVKAYSRLWDKINGKKHSWESNPWVWVIEFKKI